MQKDLKSKIKKAFEKEVPNFKENIISACEKETQVETILSDKKTQEKKSFSLWRFVAIASCVVLFATGILIGKIIPDFKPIITTETCVYIDVNPSIEINLDENNTVLSCVAGNDDAEVVLNEMKLDGLELKTAINAIVGSMYINGYLTLEDNSMLISVDSKTKNNTGEFLTYITNQVNEVFKNSEMECAIIAQSVNADESLKRRADEQGVSIGKMHLLDKMVEGMEDLTENDISELAGMSIKDLNLIYTTKPNESDKPKEELISGTISVNITTDTALNLVLTEIGKQLEDVQESKIFILPSMHGGNKAVYTVILKLHNNSEEYIYEVDCKTGEVKVSPMDNHKNEKDPDHENREEKTQDGDKPNDNIHEDRPQ